MEGGGLEGRAHSGSATPNPTLAGVSGLAGHEGCGNVCGMSTLTVELPDDMAAWLAAESEQRHVPPAQFIREALEKARREGEANRLLREMAQAAEADRLAGKHDPALAEADLREHRARHPYQ